MRITGHTKKFLATGSIIVLTGFGASVLSAGAAAAASGGGCTSTPGDSPITSVNACASASAYAQLVADAYIYTNSTTCVYVREYVHDYTTNTLFWYNRTWYQECGSTSYYIRNYFNNQYDTYSTAIRVMSGPGTGTVLEVSDQSPAENMP